MLTVVGWLWKSPSCSVKYLPSHANAWARMIHRNLTIPHRFLLFTDHPEGKFDTLIEPRPLWNDWRDLINEKWGRSKPNCYVRLKAFSEEARELIGERFVSIDLDCLVLRSLDPLFDRDDDFLIFRRDPPTGSSLSDPGGRRAALNCYQGSMWMMTAGARAKVWDEFKGTESTEAARQYMGTDQAWIRHCLGPEERGWNKRDGVYGWPNLETEARFEYEAPKDARIIFFYGNRKPWSIPSNTPPRCKHCGSPIQDSISEPYKLVHRGGFTNTHRWVIDRYESFL